MLEGYREELKQLISRIGIRHGDFTLSSGSKSAFYIDGKRVSLSAGGAFLISELILGLLEGVEVDAIGGMTLGADPIAAAVACRSWEKNRPIDAFIVRQKRKDYGLGKRIEGQLAQNAKVVIVEDVVTSGRSALEAAKAVEEEKDAKVVKVICLVDREEGGRENIQAEGFDFHAIFTASELSVRG